jgi:predicted PurR-regulated permease PerM
MISFKVGTRNILFVVGGIVIVFLLWYFSAIVTYILISAVLSFIGRPVVKWLHKIKIWKLTIPVSLAAFVTLIFIWLVFFGFFRFMIPMLINEFDTFSSINFDEILKTIEQPIVNLARFLKHDEVATATHGSTFFDLIREQLSARIDFSKLTNVLGFVAGTLGNLLIGFFSVSFITFFFLKDQDMFRNGILLLVPTYMEEKVGKILSSISYLLRRYFIGLICEILLIMLLITIGLLIVGIEFQHAVIIGMICGFFNIIPYLGPWMSSAIGMMIAIAINVNADFMTYTLPLIGWMAVVFGTVHLIDNILFQPLIYSSSVKSHPLEIFLVIIAAGSIAGILGMFLAIPTYTILRVVAKEFFDNLKIVKKITENLDDENMKIPL